MSQADRVLAASARHPGEPRPTALDPPLDLRVRLWLRIASWLRTLGYYPTMTRMPQVSLARRKASRPAWWMTRPLPPSVRIENYGRGDLGLPEAIRTYRPAAVADPVPVVLFMHGGGFVNGGLDAMQFLCAHAAGAAETLVVSVDYPLAPEAPFPAALDAAYDTLCWLADNAERLGGDPTDLTVMGDSAGGNLAAALALLARNRTHPRISRQVLIYPALDATLGTPRMRGETIKRRAECDAFYGHYAGNHDRTDELISPLLADDLSNLPPALILTAEHDALRDDGRLYAARLEEAGVAVRYTNYLGMPHGFLSMPRLCRAAPQAIAEIASVLSQPGPRRPTPTAATYPPTRP